MMADKISEKIKERLPGIREQIPLKDFTNYKIGGPAKYFFNAENKQDLMKAIKTAKDFNLPVFILGGGSNVLVSDKGFDGIVIKISNEPYGEQATKFQISNFNEVYAAAGAALDDLVDFTANAGLSGLEWAAGIPGATIGGSIYGHAQAFGDKISDVIKSVEAIDFRTLEIKNFSKKQCQFALKDSIFKRNKNLIIISAVLEFREKDSEEIKREIEKNISYRSMRHPIKFPSAGSTFVNPEAKIKNKKLLMEFPELAEYNKKGIIPAGYLISECGLAGEKFGMAQISEQHSNFIVNLGGAKASDVLNLIKLAKEKVKEKFGIELEEEVQFIGF